MKTEELKSSLYSLLSRWEDEVVEFKRAGAGFSTGEIGEYFSALANEANLRCLPRAWLVFGVDNKTHKVIGTDYDASPDALNRAGGIKYQITQSTDPGVCFSNIHVLDLPEGRVIMFEIPPAPKGIPIAWKGHYYSRSGENLMALGLDKLDAIRGQGTETDWSAQIVDDATLDDLDEEAILFARQRYAEKHVKSVDREDVDGWSLETFLDKARLTRNGKITRAAMLLVGKELAAQKLSPYMAQLVWKLVGEEQANEIFRPPYLLATTRLYSRIRNVQVRMVVTGTLMQIEVPKYSDKMVLEALHNCIAHQDYTRNGRIIVTEYIDRLTLENRGSFFYGKPEDYIAGDKTPPEYRNPQLVDAMSELNMIDTMGYGIHRMYADQAKRYMPMHDYECSSDSVRMTIYGRIVNEMYSSLLVKRPNLPIDQIVLLDRVQKGLKVTAAAVSGLRKAGLVEGRLPHLHISAEVALATGQEAAYMRKKERTGEQYRRIFIDFLKKFPGISRKKINDFMIGEIRGDLTGKQKISKISNIMTVLRRKGRIVNRGNDKEPSWFYIDTLENSTDSQCKSQSKRTCDESGK